MNRKQIYTIAAVFAVLLVSSVVYAAWTGVLNFSGTAELNQTVRLDIVGESITDKKASESIAVSTPEGETLTFTVELDAPNDTRYVNFSIRNAGNLPVILSRLDIIAPSEGSGVVADWPNVQNMVIQPGETSDEQTIAVHWAPTHAGITQSVNLSATVNYEQHIP